MYDEQCFSDELVLLGEGKLRLEEAAYKIFRPGVLNLRRGGQTVHTHSCARDLSFPWAEGFLGLPRGLCLIHIRDRLL